METTFPSIRRNRLTSLQVNLGYRCNMTCRHCHVNAGPSRTEEMDRTTVDQVLEFLRASRVRTLDLTGGAPELNPQFRYLVDHARSLGAHIIDRCNLTILLEPGHEDLAEYLAERQVEITASLPCYIEDNVNNQRGNGAFSASIKALRTLNTLGYGNNGSGLILNLVYNPQGPQLPPPQEKLSDDYKHILFKDHGIVFNELFTITNMPIKRFAKMLFDGGQYDEYMDILRAAYQPSNLENIMCRSLISIDWQGYVYDCDFNQMLELPLNYNGKQRVHISELVDRSLNGNPIAVRDHCYGCAAGQGSSCGGALGGCPKID